MDIGEIHNLYWGKIYRICMGYVNDYSKAQDLSQEIFIKIWKNLDKFRNESNISTWIYRIATNQCLRQIEIDRKFKMTELPINLEYKESNQLDSDIQLLYRYISELSEIERIIITLELEDVNQKQIAEITGISPANVRVKIHRIKEKLRNKFKSNE